MYGIATKRLNSLVFEVLLGIFVIGYSFLNDVAEPYRLGMLQGMTFGRRQACPRFHAGIPDTVPLSILQAPNVQSY